jgi:subtilisin family serine protease
MRKLLSALSLGIAAALSFGSPVARAQGSVALSAAEGSNRWYVELTGAPVADGNTRAAVQAEKATFRKAAAAAGIKYTERRSFDVLFNGVAIELSPTERLKLARLPGVKAMYPIQRVAMPQAERLQGAGSVPDLATAIQMTGADIAQNTLGLTGAGIKVAVMDTGIEIDHPDFGGTGVPGTTPFPNARLVAGYDFVGDDYDAATNPVPVPDTRPQDCAGHGTHVAGIVGAHGAVTGVAPDVKFGIYRVFGCVGSTDDDIMLAAMERALADGMQVLNMSIGSAFTWPQYPTAQAADRLVGKGMVVVASFGNSGANGLYSGGAPGVGQKVIGVASFDNTSITLPAFTISPDNTPIGFVTAAGSPAAPTSGTLPMARTGTSTTTNDACSALPAGSLTGKAVLIRRGSCAFYVKAFNAQSAGAAAVVLYNNASGIVNPTVAGTPAITIPVVATSDTQGALIDSRLAAGPVDMTWGTQTTRLPSPTGGLISSFSSYGLAPDLSLKPNIGAPGGNIYSTYPIALGSYASLSGTSMASPHVAGAAALILQARPKTASTGMKSLMQNSADPHNWWGNPSLGFLDNVHRQGAGMLDIPGAVLSKVVVEPSELALGESQAGAATRTLTIRNTTAAPVNLALSHVGALSTGPNTFTPAFGTGFAAVSFSAPSVVVPANGSASVGVTITANAGLADDSLYGGYIVLTPDDGSPAYRVPYAGLKGDYQAIQVLTPTANGFPWLAKVSGDSLLNEPGGASYTLVDGDIPYVLLHLNHQAQRVRLEAFDANTGKSWNRISDDQYVVRNTTATGFFSFVWDGSTFSGQGKNGNQRTVVPNGQYVVKVSVLKALGDPNNPADWETWTSPVVTIARP